MTDVRTSSRPRGIGAANQDLIDKSQYYMRMYRSPIIHRPQVVVDQFHILYNLFLLGDLFTELEETPPRALNIIQREMPLLFREWISFRICTYVAAYPAAARTLRWIYESSLASTIAVVSSSLLGGTSNKPLSVSQFRKWLWKYDHRKAKFPMKDGLVAIGLSTQDQARYLELYSTLCKYSHLSERLVIRPGWLPDLQFDPTKFDAISRFAYRTTDLAIYSIIRAITCHWELKEFWKSYLDRFRADSEYGVGKLRLPLTYAIVRDNACKTRNSVRIGTYARTKRLLRVCRANGAHTQEAPSCSSSKTYERYSIVATRVWSFNGRLHLPKSG